MLRTLALMAWVTWTASAAPPLPEKGGRVLFLGDSITWAGDYVTDFITWAEAGPCRGRGITWLNLGLSSETVSGLSEEGHAGGRFPRPDLHERLGRVLEQTKPDLVFACYGMNCGIQQPLDEGRFGRYRDGILRLRKEADSRGAGLVLLTPPYFDGTRAPDRAYYNGVLATYAEWLLAQRAAGWEVIDIHGAMTRAIDARRRIEPAFSVQRDAVHPDAAGHWMIASAMIGHFGGKAAPFPSVRALLEKSGVAPGLRDLCRERMVVQRDAWLTATGHKRPGVPKGLPLEEMERRSAEISRRIAEGLAESGVIAD